LPIKQCRRFNLFNPIQATNEVLDARLVCSLYLRSNALEGEPAVTMVLHTWGQTLTEHFHVHCVVSGSGLALDQSAWIGLPKGKKKRRRPFLFPVKALSEVFRGKYIAALKRARDQGELRFVGHSAELADPAPWQELLDALAETDWVVYTLVWRPCGRMAEKPSDVSRRRRNTRRRGGSNALRRWICLARAQEESKGLSSHGSDG
jgi:hypothetical protein